MLISVVKFLNYLLFVAFNDMLFCFVQVSTLERDIQRYKSNKKRELKIIAGTRTSKSSSYRKY